MNMILSLKRNLYLPVLPIFQWGVYFLLNFLFLVTIPNIFKSLFNVPWKKLHFSYKIFGKFGCIVFKIKPKLHNPSNINLYNQYIIASNHRSWFDQISLMAIWPQNMHFLAKSDYFKIPFFKYCLRSYQVIPVHNKMLKSKTQEKVDHYLNKGDSFCYFVEGTRGSGKKLLKFKKGAFLQAAKTGKPILPIYLLGTEECLSKQKNLLSVKGGDVSIVVGEPIFFSLKNLEQEMNSFELEYTKRFEKLYEDFRTNQQIIKYKLINKSFKDFSV